MKNIIFNKYLNLFILIAVCIALGYFIGSQYGSSGNNSSNALSSSYVNSNLFNEVFSLIKSQYYYKNTNNNNLYYSAISGMVNSLGDIHTLFFTPKEAKSYYSAISGNTFAGIGVSLGYNSQGKVEVEQVLPNTPAKSAGLSVGDIILSVNGNTTTNIDKIVNEVRGVVGTYVNLKIKNIQNKIESLKIQRKNIHIASENITKLSNGVVDLQITRFSDTSLTDWENSFNNAMQKVAALNPTKLIIDLRGNPGGYFDAAIYAAGDFLPQNTVVAKQEDRNGNITNFTTSYQGNFQKIPIIILVNGGTASAAEIFSGALQYYHRATIIGQNTYGKGTAQNVTTFSNGSLLILTTKHWLLPSGRWITPKHPIIPNVKVVFSSKDFLKGIDNQLQAAEKYN